MNMSYEEALKYREELMSTPERIVDEERKRWEATDEILRILRKDLS